MDLELEGIDIRSILRRLDDLEIQKPNTTADIIREEFNNKYKKEINMLTEKLDYLTDVVYNLSVENKQLKSILNNQDKTELFSNYVTKEHLTKVMSDYDIPSEVENQLRVILNNDIYPLIREKIINKDDYISKSDLEKRLEDVSIKVITDISSIQNQLLSFKDEIVKNLDKKLSKPELDKLFQSVKEWLISSYDFSIYVKRNELMRLLDAKVNDDDYQLDKEYILKKFDDLYYRERKEIVIPEKAVTKEEMMYLISTMTKKEEILELLKSYVTTKEYQSFSEESVKNAKEFLKEMKVAEERIDKFETYTLDTVDKVFTLDKKIKELINEEFPEKIKEFKAEVFDEIDNRNISLSKLNAKEIDKIKVKLNEITIEVLDKPSRVEVSELLKY